MSIRLSITGAALALIACGGGGTGAPDGGGSNTFLAFDSTFASFRTWTSFHSDGPVDDGTFPADVLGPRTQYINMLPPPGSHEFPIGTVIVEARENGSGKIFAGVKRGGGFNATGAINWEWFELVENPVSIFWRGFGPPLGDTYGGDAMGGCNACHTKCGATNDYVCSAQLQLATF
jgi:hypothetical protein